MGSSLSKDDSVDLYLMTNKRYYYSGDVIQGQACLNVRKQSNYNNLTIRVEGIEKIEWWSGYQQLPYEKQYKSYSDYFNLVDFDDGVVKPGQYVFPIEILLPNMITGSFKYNFNNYIKYFLKLQLVHPISRHKAQVYQMPLNILEMPRSPIRPISKRQSVHSCCECCTYRTDYGTSSVLLNCNTNFVLSGDCITVDGQIDNTQGKITIQQTTFLLYEKVFLLYDSKSYLKYTQNKYLLLKQVQKIPKGSKKGFNHVLRIPSNIQSSTALGTILARYFVLKLATYYGRCNKTVSAQLPLLVQSKNPKLKQYPAITPPMDWNPVVYNKIVWNNMKPYIYKPYRSIQLATLNLCDVMPRIDYYQMMQQNMAGKQQNMINTKISVSHRGPSIDTNHNSAKSLMMNPNINNNLNRQTEEELKDNRYNYVNNNNNNQNNNINSSQTYQGVMPAFDEGNYRSNQN